MKKVLVVLGISFSLPAFADTLILNPKVNGAPVDNCATINGSNDCSNSGHQMVYKHACQYLGFSDTTNQAVLVQQGGTASHISIAVVPGTGQEIPGTINWTLLPTGAVVDQVTCR